MFIYIYIYTYRERYVNIYNLHLSFFPPLSARAISRQCRRWRLAEERTHLVPGPHDWPRAGPKSECRMRGPRGTHQAARNSGVKPELPAANQNTRGCPAGRIRPHVMGRGCQTVAGVGEWSAWAMPAV